MKTGAFKNLLKGTILSGVAAPILAWWPVGWRTAIHPDSKPDVGTPSAQIAVDEIKEELAIATASYHADKNGMEAHKKISEDTVREFIKPYYEKLEFLESHETENGFYACVFKNKETDQICLSIAGLTGANWDDIYTAFQSTAGIIPKQFEDLKNFNETLNQKYGGVDVICGHSIGGYLGTCLKAGGLKHLKPGTELYVFDTPGVSFSLMNQLEKEYGISQSAIKSNLSSNTTSVIVTRNAYNTLGDQPGKHYTLSSPENDGFHMANILPVKHLIKTFVKEMSAAEGKLHSGSREGNSGGPLIITAGLLAAAALTVRDKLIPKKISKDEAEVVNNNHTKALAAASHSFVTR